MGFDMTVNRLPAPTWNWLHMNEVRLKEIAVNREGRLSLETPDGIDTYEEKPEKPEQNMEEYAETASNPESVRKQLSDIPSGMGADMDALLNQNGAGFRIWKTVPGDKETEPVRLHFNYKDGEKVQNRIGIYAGKDSELTVIMDFRGEGELQSPESVAAGNDGNNRNSENDRKDSTLAAIQTKIHAEEGARVRLIQIQKLPDDFRFLNDVGISCGEGAQIETIQFMLGGDTCMGMRADLAERLAGLKSKIGYSLGQRDRLDMNYLAYHTGAGTNSQMEVSGVLRGQAEKLFRGTIDFRHGSVGAKGDEKEDVLLFSDDAVNRTIPLILCEEEDVEGNHGATIGRLDESLLFYLASRGIAEEAAYEMMAKARMDAICRDIPDEKTRELVQTYLDAGNAVYLQDHVVRKMGEQSEKQR